MCSCLHGLIKCESIKCPPLKCRPEERRIVKNECCASCVGEFGCGVALARTRNRRAYFFINTYNASTSIKIKRSVLIIPELDLIFIFRKNVENKRLLSFARFHTEVANAYTK